MNAQYAVERIVHRITILTASAEDFVSTLIFGATKLTSTVDRRNPFVHIIELGFPLTGQAFSCMLV